MAAVPYDQDSHPIGAVNTQVSNATDENLQRLNDDLKKAAQGMHSDMRVILWMGIITIILQTAILMKLYFFTDSEWIF